MTYTYKTLALVWLLMFGLFALSASGMVAGSWVLLLIAADLGLPLLLTLSAKPRSVAAVTISGEHALAVSGVPLRSSRESSGIEVYRWENEGGARRV